MGPGFRFRAVLVSVIVLVWGAAGGLTGAYGQNNRYTDRSFVSSPVALAMGDAGVALSGVEHPFFYNPAQLPSVSSHFTILGVQGASSPSLPDQIRFLNDDVEPAVSSSSDGSTNAFADIHETAQALANRPGRGHGAVLLPSFVYSPNAVGVGGGIFTKTALNYRVERRSGSVPDVWLLSRTDVMALASLGLNLDVVGLPQVSIGVTGTQTRRFLSFKNKSMDRLREDEPAIALDGSSFQMDVGVVYRPTWVGDVPGTLRVGAAVYDALTHGYGYTSGTGTGAGRMPFVEDLVGPPADGDKPRLGPERRRAQQLFPLRTSYRVGVAYQVATVSFMEDVAAVLDYQGYGNQRQEVLARMHAGVRAQVVGPVRLRAGVSAGYPSGGVGVRAGILEVDYAVHGTEEGRQPGQLGTYVHTARLLLRLK